MGKELIKQQRLSNGVVLSIFDNSRKLLGDRWLVTIECEAALPAQAEFIAEKKEENPELLDMILEKLGKTISFSVCKERNFVAESDIGSARDGLIEQVYENMTEYLDNQAFPKKLFESRYAELKEICLLKLQIKRVDELDDEDGPTDFSSCFKD